MKRKNSQINKKKDPEKSARHEKSVHKSVAKSNCHFKRSIENFTEVNDIEVKKQRKKNCREQLDKFSALAFHEDPIQNSIDESESLNPLLYVKDSDDEEQPSNI
jgi:hypothetical protein